MNQIKLDYSCISNVPLNIYDDEFSFIVNKKEFKVNRLISDLLSPKISKIHSIDPTFNKFIINTKQNGNFSKFLNLIQFQTVEFKDDELPFISEIVEKLENTEIKANLNHKKPNLTNKNIISLISKHDKCPIFYSSEIMEEIEYVSNHFSELYSTYKEKLSQLSIETLHSILSKDDQIQLNDEDELLEFVNNLYERDKKYSILYENVKFVYVSSDKIKEFLKLFDYNDINRMIWTSLSNRLSQEVVITKNNHRIKSSGQIFSPTIKNFNGIIDYLKKKTNGKIENTINITASSYNDKSVMPINSISFEDRSKYFCSNNSPGSWLCFDFKNDRIIPTHYQIRTFSCFNGAHPRNWVIECSNDNENWETIDEEKDCNFLNGASKTHIFKIKKQVYKDFQYVRYRSTGVDWVNENWHLCNSFEIYGTLIEK